MKAVRVSALALFTAWLFASGCSLHFGDSKPSDWPYYGWDTNSTTKVSTNATSLHPRPNH